MDGIEVRAAAGVFLAEALGWPGEPGDIGDVLELAQDRDEEAVYAAEIETADGALAILVFAFTLSDAGVALRAEAVRTMLEAAELGTPGPRIVAEGEVNNFGLVLATTPAGLAILTGEGDEQARPEAVVEPSPNAAARAQAADALLDALREANARAGELQRLLPAAGTGAGERSVEERALALFLIDPASLADLTRVMRRVVDDAARAAQPK